MKGSAGVRVRRLHPRGKADLQAELRSVAPEVEFFPSWMQFAEILLFRVAALPAAAARLLQQEALCVGVPAGVHPGVRRGEVAASDAVIAVPPSKLSAFADRLRRHPLGLSRLADEIERQAAGDDPRAFRVGEKVYRREGRPFIMGIVNVTPDSFSDGGLYLNPDRAADHARQLVAEGADFLDIGAESTRPGSLPVSADQELERLEPVLERLLSDVNVPLSVDTAKAAVARRALEMGVSIVNDVTALRADPDMAAALTGAGATTILMHMQGEPRTMQECPHYDDLMAEVYGFLEERVAAAQAAGIASDRLLVDPGIGFGKRLGDNCELLGRLGEFATLGPVLVGPSRKSFIGKLLGVPPEERLFGTASAVVVATLNGADVIRVHDVRAMIQAAEIAHQCRSRKEEAETAAPPIPQSS